MSRGLLFHCDDQLAAQFFTQAKSQPFKYENCLGIVDKDQGVIGYVFFHYWNGSNIELSYYGERTLTPGIIRTIARFIICTFDASRLTVATSKRRKRFMRSLQRFGFKLEGTQRCYYGKRDCSRNTAVRFVMFRDRIDQLARLPKEHIEHADRTAARL